MSEQLPASDRIKRRGEFRAIQSQGVRAHTKRFLVMVAANSDASASRVGITVTKKVGVAVVRNRIKRVVREVFRRHRDLFPPGCDYVFIAKRGLDPAAFDYESLRREVRGARGAIAKAARKAREREPEIPRSREP